MPKPVTSTRANKFSSKIDDYFFDLWRFEQDLSFFDGFRQIPVTQASLAMSTIFCYIKNFLATPINFEQHPVLSSNIQYFAAKNLPNWKHHPGDIFHISLDLHFLESIVSFYLSSVLLDSIIPYYHIYQYPWKNFYCQNVLPCTYCVVGFLTIFSIHLFNFVKFIVPSLLVVMLFLLALAY